MSEMTLRTALRKIRGRYVKIGAAVGYLYIGPVGDDICRRMEGLDDDLIGKGKQLLHKAMTAYIRTDERVRSQAMIAESESHEIWTENEIQYRIKKEKKDLKIKVTDKKKYLDEYIPLLDRRVIDVYGTDPYIEEHEMAVLIVEGEETGVYWLLSEYENWKPDDALCLV